MGANPQYYFQKFDSWVCGETCLAYHYYEVWDKDGMALHGTVKQQFAILRESAGPRDFDIAYVTNKYTETQYHFRIKVIGYNGASTWLGYPYGDPSANETHTLRVYCDEHSATLKEHNKVAL